MKNRIKTLAIFFLLVLLPIKADASEYVNPYGEPYKVRCTCYIAENEEPVTRSGVPPREGMIAGRYEDLGKTAILYRVDKDGTIGELIGFYDFADTGGHEDLNNGKRIDVYRESMDGVNAWVKEYGDYVFIQIVDAKG